MGLRYERSVAKALPLAQHGQWIEFEDSAGRGWAQPDFLLRFEDKALILETKYTWVAEGHSQIELLYRPLIERLFELEVVGLVVCRTLVPEAPASSATIEEALIRRRNVVQWIGVGPLLQPFRPRPIAGLLSVLRAGV